MTGTRLWKGVRTTRSSLARIGQMQSPTHYQMSQFLVVVTGLLLDRRHIIDPAFVHRVEEVGALVAIARAEGT